MLSVPSHIKTELSEKFYGFEDELLYYLGHSRETSDNIITINSSCSWSIRCTRDDLYNLLVNVAYLITKIKNIGTYYNFKTYLSKKHKLYHIKSTHCVYNIISQKIMTYANRTIILRYDAQYDSTNYMVLLELEAYDIRDKINSTAGNVMLLMMLINRLIADHY